MKRRLSFFASLLLAFSACSGGGSQIPPAAPGASQTFAKVALTLLIPPQTASAARRAESISPSTQSIGIAVNSGAEQLFNATPTSPGCTAGSSGTSCTFNVTAPTGSDTFVVHAYSGLSGAGNLLDSASITQSIAANQTTPVNITLGPIVSTAADSGPGSLRQALADANPGDTITFTVAAPATITLSGSAVTLSKNVTISGPSNATMTISAANASRIFIINAAVTATISNLTLTQGKAANGSGGAIDNLGTLTLNSVQVTNSSATGSGALNVKHVRHVRAPQVVATTGTGGGVSNESGASLTVSNSTFTGNTAPAGGGVFSAAGSTLLNVSGSSFSANISTQYGGAIYTNIATALTNDTFSNNDGSAVYASVGLTVSGGSFTNNKAGGYSGYGYGGAIYASYGPTSLTNVSFTGNQAGDGTTYAYGYGGALYTDGDVTVTGGSFSSNVAGNAANTYGYGGAIEMDDGDLTVSNASFSGNSAGGTTANYGYGGAIDDETGNTMSITGTTFTSNKAGGVNYGYGGALYLSGRVTIDHDTFTTNSAYGSNDGYAYGGAAYIDDPAYVTNTTFTGNTATGGSLTTGSAGYAYGGGVYILAGSQPTPAPSGSPGPAFNADTFSNNTASGSNYAYGGALYMNDALAITATTFDGNAATAGNSPCGPYTYGGGIYLSNGGTMTAVTVTHNSANAGAQATGTCSAVVQGAPRQRAAPRHRHAGITAASNTFGGGIYCGGGSLTLSGTISSNTSNTDGGGLYTDCGATIAQSTFDSNVVTATNNYDGGGAINLDNGVLSISSSTLSNNTVGGSPPNNGGGGIFAWGTSYSIVNSTIVSNSGPDGGGIYSLNPGTLLNTTLFGNTATHNGGNYFATTYISLSLQNSIVAGGTAALQNNLGGVAGTSFSSKGYNIVNTSNSSLQPENTTGDIINGTVDPLLLALAANGGPTKTMADQATSPGKDLIPLSVCTGALVTTDQRGNARGDASDNKCDVGAYEFP